MFEQGRVARALSVVAGLVLLALSSGAAQDPQHHAPGHPGGADLASEAYRAAAERMHRDMTLQLTGDPDVDVARGMIPHHQGAIDMARAVLDHGQDPEIRALAEAIIAAQEQEIAFLRGWLEQRGQSID